MPPAGQQTLMSKLAVTLESLQWLGRAVASSLAALPLTLARGYFCALRNAGRVCFVPATPASKRVGGRTAVRQHALIS